MSADGHTALRLDAPRTRCGRASWPKHNKASISVLFLLRRACHEGRAVGRTLGRVRAPRRYRYAAGRSHDATPTERRRPDATGRRGRACISSFPFRRAPAADSGETTHPHTPPLHRRERLKTAHTRQLTPAHPLGESRPRTRAAGRASQASPRRSYIIRHSSTQRISTVCAGPHPTFYDVGHITRPPLSCLSDSLSASACSRPPACHKPLSHSATNLYRHWRRRHSSLGRLLLLLVGHPKEVVGKQDPQLVGR